MRASLLICILWCGFTASAQRGGLQLNAPPKLYELVERRTEMNRAKATISGYRIQIFFSSQRAAAQDERQRFMSKYPEHEAYLIYQQPYFKVRIGDFRTRLEAYRFYQQIVREFQSVFIVADEVNLPKL